MFGLYEITVEELKQKFVEQKAFVESSPNYGSPACSLFDDSGTFSIHNWCSGQDTVREVTEERLFPDNGIHKYYLGDCEYVVVAWTKYNEDSLLQVTIPAPSTEGYFTRWTTYQIGWYKSRGTTEYIFCNGEPATIEQYVELHNALAKATFEDFA